MISEIIKNIAKSYVGQKEISGNKGFLNVEFQNKISSVGWSMGQAWCAYFVELVWKEAYKNSTISKRLNELFSTSATTTYKNFDLSKEFEVSNTPEIGALAVWRHGVGWQGHIGVVVAIFTDSFDSIEGNTNDSGGREGIEVALKHRKLDFTIKSNQLNLIGFILPIKI